MRFKKINAHPFTYKVRYSNDIEDSGETSFQKRQVIISLNEDPQYNKGTLLHEMLHILLHDMNYFKEEADEEDFVLRMEPRLLAIIQDNPKIFKYLIEKK